MEFIAGLSFFWVGIVFTIAALATLISIGTNSYWWAFGIVIGTIAFSQGTTDYGILDFVARNWYGTLISTAVYVALGLGWATFAWFLHLTKIKAKYQEVRENLLPQFLASKNVQELTADLHDEFRKFIYSNAGTVLPKEQLAVNKSVMVGQVILWPFKLGAFVLGDALKYIVDAFLGLFGGFFKRIQKFVFRNFPELQA